MAFCFFCLQFVSTLASAEAVIHDADLSIKPNRCVALHEGQDCYQGIVIRWRSEKVGRYCLSHGESQAELKCWDKGNVGVFHYDFQSNKSVSFLLTRMPEGTLIATADMQVAWVYKAPKRQRMHWRLF